MSVTKFVTRKFGRLEVDDITGGSVSCTNVSVGSVIGSTVACSTLTGGLSTYSPIVKGAIITAASATTISATQLLSGSIIRTGVTSGTEYFPTAADLIARINILTNTQASAGMCFECVYLLNTAVTTHCVLGAGTDSTIGAIASATGGSPKLITCILASVSGTTGSYLIRPTNL